MKHRTLQETLMKLHDSKNGTLRCGSWVATHSSIAVPSSQSDPSTTWTDPVCVKDNEIYDLVTAKPFSRAASFTTILPEAIIQFGISRYRLVLARRDRYGQNRHSNMAVDAGKAENDVQENGNLTYSSRRLYLASTSPQMHGGASFLRNAERTAFIAQDISQYCLVFLLNLQMPCGTDHSLGEDLRHEICCLVMEVRRAEANRILLLTTM